MAYKDDALRKTQVFEWLFRFERGEILIDDQPNSRRSRQPKPTKMSQKRLERSTIDHRSSCGAI